ncbi:hypothetical protein WJX84_002218 [Apatococcus fuscideae]|uniref:Uncharacterized protein n=1 Tax=Apatococcus fuscideae TaxID=2026836 RepID=A0AAW1TM75_9CHLO
MVKAIAHAILGTPAKSLQAYKWLRQELSIWFSILTESQTSSAGQLRGSSPFYHILLQPQASVHGLYDEMEEGMFSKITGVIMSMVPPFG